jgi:hypothetical protein
MASPRVVRARQTERLLAADLQACGAPDARAVAASVAGRDILGVPGLAIEVKARTNLDMRAALRQAARNSDGDLPLVVVRCNGQGQLHIDDWVTLIYWGDMKQLLKEAGYLA